jgi:hypothetical protein
MGPTFGSLKELGGTSLKAKYFAGRRIAQSIFNLFSGKG